MLPVIVLFLTNFALVDTLIYSNTLRDSASKSYVDI